MVVRVSKRQRSVTLLAALPLVAVSPAFAGDRFWLSPTDGELHDVTRWSPVGAGFDPLDSLRISNGNTPPFTVTLPSDQSLSVLGLRVDTQQASVNVLGDLSVANLYLYGGSFNGAATITHELIVGGAGGSREFRALGNLLLNPASNVFGTPVDLFAGDTLRLRAGQPGGANSVTLNTTDFRSLRNAGTITLDALPGTTATTTATISLGGSTTALSNSGTINLLGGSVSSSSVANRRMINMPLVNEAPGRVFVDAGVNASADGGSSSGTVRDVENHGLFIVAAGGKFSATNFRQNAGAKLTVEPGANFTVSKFEMLSNDVDGTISTQTLALAAMESANATAYREGGGISIRKLDGATTGGDIPQGMTVQARATGSSSVGVGSQTAFTNRGRVVLDAKPGTNTATTATLSAGYVTNPANTSYTLNLITNDGVIDLAGGSSFAGSGSTTTANARVLNCRLLNTETGTLIVRSGVYASSKDQGDGVAMIESRGVVTLEANSTFAPTAFRLSGGVLDIAPGATFAPNRLELIDGVINGSPALAPFNTVLATADSFKGPLTLRPLNSLALEALPGIPASGNLSAVTDLRIRAAQPGASGTSVSLFSNGRSFTNFGVLTLDSAPTGSSTTVAIDLGSGSTFTNSGTLQLRGGSTAASTFANTRAVRGNFTNTAAANTTVDAGVRFEMTSATFTNFGRFELNGLASFSSTVQNNGIIQINTGGSFVGRLWGNGNGKLILNGGTMSLGVGTHSLGALDTSGADLAIAANQTLEVRSVQARDVSFTTNSILSFSRNLSDTATSRVERLLLGAGPVGSVNLANAPLIVTAAGQYELLLNARAADGPTGPIGKGVGSTLVGLDRRLGIAVVRADDLFSQGTGTYWGQPVSGDDAILRVTLRGDGNLDGSVDFNDLVRLAQSYGQQTGATWTDGDMNYDGSVAFDDLVALAQNYNLVYRKGVVSTLSSSSAEDSFAADWALAQSLVPEPVSSASIACFLAALGRRRHR